MSNYNNNALIVFNLNKHTKI